MLRGAVRLAPPAVAPQQQPNKNEKARLIALKPQSAKRYSNSEMLSAPQSYKSDPQ